MNDTRAVSALASITAARDTLNDLLNSEPPFPANHYLSEALKKLDAAADNTRRLL